jgi:hypothetical protein
MSLASRLGKLEVLVQGEMPPPETEPSAECLAWLDQLLDGCSAILATMPERYAVQAFEAIEGGRSFDEPLARRVVALAQSAAPHPDHGWQAWLRWELFWPHALQGPLVLPEATCALLESHPTTEFLQYDCERCGYRPGERPMVEWFAEWVAGGRQGSVRKSFVARCPVPGCGGAVRYSGYALSRGRCIQALQSPTWASEQHIRCIHPENECPGEAWAAQNLKEIRR